MSEPSPVNDGFNVDQFERRATDTPEGGIRAPVGGSRRDLLRDLAVVAALGALPAGAAQHVHQAAAEQKKAAGGVYQPRFFKPHEFQTLEALSELIIPGARKSGAAAFIDVLASSSDEFAAIFTGGLAWLDRAIERFGAPDFRRATPAQQSALLELIAWKKNDSIELGPGIHFFDWARRVTVDAYYTSPEGVAELGYKGNTGVAEFTVPREAIDYALRRTAG